MVDVNLTEYQNKKQSIVMIYLVGIIVALLGGVLFLLQNQSLFVYAIGLFIIGVIIIAVGSFRFASLNNKFKQEVIPQLVNSYIKNGTYTHSSGLTPMQVQESKLIKRTDEFKSEDLITGTIDEVNFTSSDLLLHDIEITYRDGKRQKRRIKVFQGRLFIFDFNKQFNGTIKVCEKWRMNGNSKQSDFFGGKLKKVKLESVQFNKKFETKASEEILAFYVLTPHLQEALLQFEKDNKGTLDFSFIGTKLFIALNNSKDTFTLKLLKKVDERIIEDFKNDFNMLEDIVKTLKLNNKIFIED